MALASSFNLKPENIPPFQARASDLELHICIEHGMYQIPIKVKAASSTSDSSECNSTGNHRLRTYLECVKTYILALSGKWFTDN